MTSSSQFWSASGALLFLLGFIIVHIKYFVVCCMFGRATNVRPLVNVAGRTNICFGPVVSRSSVRHSAKADVPPGELSI